LLEKIERGSPDRKVQGVAALGVSMILKTLGDEGDVMKRRLAMLRKAIIESSDVEIEGQTVAKLAEDELYIIRYLIEHLPPGPR
jgi:hemerythrin-like domain-containing protein